MSLDLGDLPLAVRTAIETALTEAETAYNTSTSTGPVRDGVGILHPAHDWAVLQLVFMPFEAAVVSLCTSARVQQWTTTRLRKTVENILEQLTENAAPMYTQDRDVYLFAIQGHIRSCVYWLTYLETRRELASQTPSLGKQIDGYRLEAKWTKERLALEAGIDEKSVRLQIKDEQTPTEESLDKYRKAFLIPLKRVVTFEY